MSRLLRFAGFGVLNTAIDTVLFLVLHPHLGTLLANIVSTSVGMAVSFVLNGRVTFAGRLDLRTAGAFVAVNVSTLWVVQPLLIVGLQAALPLPLAAAKLVAVGACVMVTFAAYRWVVWPSGPARAQDGGQDEAAAAALRSRRSSVGSEKMSDSSAL